MSVLTSEQTIQPVLAQGLHVRPARQITESMATFQAKVTVSNGDFSADARSVLELLGLGLFGPVTIQVAAEGEDAEEAVASLCDFFRDLEQEQAKKP
ncbi:MAG: HPr family phosphocarrier protein [Deltaproteobacteria bacterium]|nr:MAG: HPr family phosphocarrier protein [Deltaproteobacteria bacterium]